MLENRHLRPRRGGLRIGHRRPSIRKRHSQQRPLQNSQRGTSLPGRRRGMPPCSEALDRLIRRCLAKEPGDRYQTADEMLVAELRQIAFDIAPDVGTTKELTTGILRRVMQEMPAPKQDDTSPTTRVATPRSQSTTPTPRPTPQNTELHRTPEVPEPPERRRSPVLVIIFLALAAILIAAGATLIFSKQAQDLVFGEAGAPWIPTVDSDTDATATPTRTATRNSDTDNHARTEPYSHADAEFPSVWWSTRRQWSRSTAGNSAAGAPPGGPIRLSQGTHTFTLTVSDFPTKTLTRRVTATTKVISLTLEIGQLSVLVDPALAPPGGMAYLDGNVLGPVPLVRTRSRPASTNWSFAGTAPSPSGRRSSFRPYRTRVSGSSWRRPPTDRVTTRASASVAGNSPNWTCSTFHAKV